MKKIFRRIEAILITICLAFSIPNYSVLAAEGVVGEEKVIISDSIIQDEEGKETEVIEPEVIKPEETEVIKPEETATAKSSVVKPNDKKVETKNEQVEQVLENPAPAAISTLSTIASGSCGANATWILDDEGTLTISGSGKMKDYNISSTLKQDQRPWDGYRSDINRIVIEYGITHIGNSSFGFCDVSSITIPSSVISIGNNAFYACGMLESIFIPDSVVSIYETAFRSCDNLKTVTLSNSLKTISKECFRYCDSLQNITIPNGVTTIEECAFANCYNLTSITLPTGLVTIGDEAFANCDGLTSITIPRNVTSIGAKAFMGIISIVVDSANPKYSSLDGVLYNKQQTELIQYPRGKSGSFTIPDGVTRIGDYAFYACHNLTDISIPGSVTYIGNYSFDDCRGLKSSLIIPNSVTSIGEGAFRWCDYLREISISNKITYIGRNVFSYCKSLQYLIIPNGVTSIDEYAFYRCEALTRVVLPISLTSIGSRAFDSDSRITDVYYAGGANEFDGITINSENTYLTDATFHYCFEPSITNYSVTLEKSSYVYDGTKKTPNVIVSNDSTTLAGNKDYSIKYENNLSAGTATVIITGINIYCGSKRVNFYINKANQSLTVTPSSVNITEGSSQTLSVTGTKGSLSYSSSNTNVATVSSSGIINGIKGGSATITVTASATNNYNSESKTVTVTVKEKVGPVNVSVTPFSGTYDGNAHSATFNFSTANAVIYYSTSEELTYDNYEQKGSRTNPSRTNAGITTVYYIVVPSSGASSESAVCGRTTIEILQASPELFFAQDTVDKLISDVPFINELRSVTDGTLSFASSKTSVATVDKSTGRVTIIGEGTAIISVAATGNGNYKSGTASYELNVTYSGSNGILLNTLSYKFRNNRDGFGYDLDYQIPLSSYQIIFGNTTKAKTYWYHAQKNSWGGNCFGMASTASLIFDRSNELLPSTFDPTAKIVSELDVTDRSSNYEMTVREFIEAFQISQKTKLVSDERTQNRIYSLNLKNGSTNLNSLYNGINRQITNEIPVIIAVWQDGGHAILGYRIDEISAKESRLYVYDNNYPLEERYMTFTKDGSGNVTEWSYNMGGSYGVWNSQNDASSISYITYGTIAEIWNTRGNLDEDMNVAILNSANVAIYDSDNRLAASMVDGELVSVNKKIHLIEEDIEYTVKKANETIIALPIDVYTLKNKDSSVDLFEVTLIDNELGATVQTSASSVMLAVDDSCNLNSVLIDAKEEDTYSVTLNSSYGYDHEEVIVKGTGNDETMEVSQVKGSITINNCQITSLAIDGTEINTYSITATSGNGGSVTPEGTISVVQGASQEYEIIPEEGYEIEDVKIDGKSVGVTNKYSFDKIKASHTIHATFRSTLGVPEVPTIVSVYSTVQNSVKVTWTKVDNAAGYQLYRATSPDGSFSCIKTITDGNTIKYTNGNLSIGTTYYYKVRAYGLDNKGSRIYSDFSDVRYMPAAVVFDNVYPNLTTRIRILWKEVGGANGYQIWRSDSLNGTYKIVKTITSGKTTAYSNTGLESGKIYYYKMRAYEDYNGGKVFGTYSDVFAVATLPESPDLIVKSSTEGKATLSWTKIAGATGYQIWRSESPNGMYNIIKSITDGTVISYNNSGLISGKKYYYKIRAYIDVNGKKIFGDYSTIEYTSIK